MRKDISIPKIQTALVACSRLVDYTGSELATLEIASGLKELGLEVEIATFDFDDPLLQELKSRGFKCHNLLKNSLVKRSFDLLWVSHAFTAYQILLRYRVSVKFGLYSSLSHFEPLEAPPDARMEFTQYLVHSSENENYFKVNYPQFRERVALFTNAAPSEFFINSGLKQRNGIGLKSLAVISNHVPEELYRLKEILGLSNISLDYIGENDKTLIVTPELLGKYDAVITIGKTVQYCLAMGIPVFCYDRFGGPGWIVPANFENALKFNFSGRCTAIKLTALEIKDRLIREFESSYEDVIKLKKIAEEKFNLNKNLSCLLKAVTAEDKMKSCVDETTNNILLKNVDLFIETRLPLFRLRTREKYLISNIEERDALITARNHDVEERDALIKNLISNIEERDALITARNHDVEERDALIKNLISNIEERDALITARNHDVEERDALIKNLISNIEERDALITARNYDITDLKNAIKEKDDTYRNLINTKYYKFGKIIKII